MFKLDCEFSFYMLNLKKIILKRYPTFIHIITNLNPQQLCIYQNLFRIIILVNKRVLPDFI